MKEHIKLIAVAVILILTTVTIGLAKRHTTYSIYNSTSYTIGDVMIMVSPSDTVHVDVSGSGAFYGTVPSPPAGIQINGVVIPNGESRTVTTADGHQVKVDCGVLDTEALITELA
jgi:hypothetical protein